MTYPTTEQVEKARQASLADFLIQNGFATELTKNELHVKGDGGLYINTDTNEWYCFSQPPFINNLFTQASMVQHDAA